MTGMMIFLIGSAGVNSLLIPFSPSGINTGFSMARGGEAAFYNPANLDATDEYSVSFYYNQLYVGMKRVSLALSKKLNKLNTGLAITNLDYGEIEWHPDYPSEDSGAYYTANDFTLSLTGSCDVSASGMIGLTIKYIAENIYIYGDDALACDLALAYKGDRGKICFGVTNVGYKLRINTNEVNLPAKLSVGGCLNIKKAVASFDVHYLVNTEKLNFSHAWTYTVSQLFEVKAGINYEDRLYPGFGFGINATNFSVKYGTAFYPYNLGMINTVGIGLAF